MQHRLTSILLYIGIVLLFVQCKSAKLPDAHAAFKRGEYFEAASIYRKVYSKTSPTKERKLRGEIALQIGHCYDQINVAPRATNAYLNALRYHTPDTLIHLYIARNKHKEGKYRDAIKHYQIVLDSIPNQPEALSGKAGAALAEQWKEQGTRYKISKAPLFNLRRADFSPMISGQEKDMLYFTSANDKTTGDDKSNITGLKPCDIYVSTKDEAGNWIKPVAIEGDVNTAFDEGTPSFSPDGSTMYFTVARKDPAFATSTEIFTSQRNGGKWGKPQKLHISKDTLSLYAHPAVSLDGKSLYFVSDMPGGMGGKDIWRATLTNSGVGTIENLGDRINTSGDEMFPTLHPSGDLLFSSNGHEGMGGLDLFRAHEDEWGIWTIQNLQAPLNSAGDDFGMTFTTYATNDTEEAGFFSSNRNDARGWDHIYGFELPSIKVRITGYVVNQDQEVVSNAIVRVVGKDGSNQKVVAKNDGTFALDIDRAVRYVMMAGAKGYLNDQEEFMSDGDESDATYQVIFQLASIDRPVLIENILYDFDKATLRPESATALDDLVELLNINPHVTIELAAHTDRKGTDAYNDLLSQRRAQSVIDYLITHGVMPSRLYPKGYGKSTPKVVSEYIHKQYPDFLPIGQVLDEAFVNTLPAEQQEVVDQINRRTEFQVKETTFLLE